MGAECGFEGRVARALARASPVVVQSRGFGGGGFGRRGKRVADSRATAPAARSGPRGATLFPRKGQSIPLILLFLCP